MGIYMCVFAVCVTAIIIAYMLITQNSNENSNVNLTFEKKDEPQIYGNEYNCIMTMFGECSYAETGCGDCAVVEKVRKALAQTENSSEKPNNCEPQTENLFTDKDGDVWEWRGDAWYCISGQDEPQTERSV